jgi:4-amino-4-deoxy-L-arabinose transferase-like glycosyltransferase
MNQNTATSAKPGVAQPEKSSPYADALGGLAVLCLVSPLILWKLSDEPHFADETAMIAQSYYYTLFKSGQWNHPDWLQYAAYDHPPLPKYLFGLSLDAAGLPVPTTLGPWLNWMRGDFSPPGDRRVLLWARLPSALFGVGGTVALYSIGVQVHSRLAGALAAALLALNPLYLTHARRAMSDSFTECLVIASVAVGLWGCRAIWNRRHSWWTIGAILLGDSVLCGLAALAKLNGGIAAVITFALIAGTWILGLVARGRGVTRGARSLSPLPLVPPLVAIAVILVSFVVFVCLNPLMTARPELPANAPGQIYELAAMGPIARAEFLVQFRREWSRDALANQAFRKDWLETFAERARMTVWEGFGRFSPFGPRDIRTREPRPDTERFTDYHRISAMVWLPLVSWGILLALCQGWQVLRAGRPPLAWGLLLYLAASMAIVMFMIPLNWDRYYLPLQAPAILLATIGVVSAVRGWG